MTTNHSALLLVGSGKPQGESTSEALGSYLLDRLAALGYLTKTAFVHRVLRTEDRTQEFLQELDAAGLFILAFPLYVDTLPHLATRALERIAEHRQSDTPTSPTRFLAIANCGFPEAEHNATALAICRQFAVAAGFAWAGGLALGAGGALHGQPLAAAGGLARNVTRALDLAAEAVAEGGTIPEEVAALMAQPLLPSRLYTLMGDFGWRWQARQNGVYRRLGARPFGPH